MGIAPTILGEAAELVATQAAKGRRGVSMGADRKANTLGRRGALERGHGAPVEPLAQLGDALGSVCTVNCAKWARGDAAELVSFQAAREGMSVNGR